MQERLKPEPRVILPGTERFNNGDHVALVKNYGMHAPVGTVAVVNGYDRRYEARDNCTYVLVEWVNYADQNNGGYHEDSFVLVGQAPLEPMAIELINDYIAAS